MEFEDILLEVGDFGRYQKCLLVAFMGPVAALTAFFYLSNLFIISVPEHWCRVPELADFNLSVEQEKLLRPESDPSCSVYNTNYTNLLAMENWTIPENTPISKCIHGWNYDTTNYDFTAATQWNLVCDDSHYVSFVLTVFSFGSIIGTPILGSLSDRFGRKFAFFVVVLVNAISGIASVLVTDFSTFIVLRAITGSIMPSLFQLPFIIVLELIGPEKRATANVISGIAWTIGMCTLPLIAWLSRDWITFGLITSSVLILIFPYWLVLPESPRWLLLKEKYDEATEVISKIAKRNGKDIESEDISYNLRKLGERRLKEEELEKNDDRKIWKSSKLRKIFLIITYAWIANYTAFYGLQINGHNLAGNEFLNFFLLGLAEGPAYICGWLFMEKIGRRWCTVSGMTLSGIACVIAGAHPPAAVGASFVGKFCISLSFMSMYQQASELYPTSSRASLLGMSATCSSVATIAVPYMVYLNKYGTYIPFVIIAFLSITAGFCCCFLPETLNEILPQTVLDSEKFGNGQKFFSWKKEKRLSIQIEMTHTSRRNTCTSADIQMTNEL